MPSLAQQAKAAGIEIRDMGDRVEAWKGEKIIAFNCSRDTTIKKALERVEEDRLRRLPYDQEVDLRRAPPPHVPTRGVAPPVRARALAPVAVPVVTAILDAVSGPPAVYDEPTAGAAVAKIIKGSIVKDKYKNKYKANGGSCGDEVAEELGEFVRIKVGGQLRTSVERLVQVAKDNAIWLERYASLNVGQLRMTVGNRLRIKYAEGATIVIGGAPFCQKIEV